MRDRDVRRDALEYVEVDVHLGGTMIAVPPQGPDHLGQGRQKAAIDGGQAAQRLGLLADRDRQGLRGQVADDLAKQFGIEDTRGFTERARARSLTAQQLLDLRELAGLLDGTEAGENGVEVEQQDQGAVLVEMENAIPGAVAFRATGLESFQKRLEDLEVLKPREITVRNRGLAFSGHRTITETTTVSSTAETPSVVSGCAKETGSAS